MDSKNTLELFLQQEHAAREQFYNRQTKLLKFCAAACGVVALTMLVCVLVFAPKLYLALNTIEEATASMSEAGEKLAHIDFESMIKSIDLLVEENRETIGEALEKIASIDIQTLNEAIGDLQRIIEPLARLFGR